MKDIKKTILDIHNFRHACKLFDTNKIITDDDFKTLLEVANLSPTSFGMQGVRLYVVKDSSKKKLFKKACWNQNQIDSCSHLVLFTTKTKELLPQSKWVRQRFETRGLKKDMLDAYIKKYEEFHQSSIAKDTYQWASRQAYIIMANMLTTAAMLEIDSCPIEGFIKEDVEEILGIDTNEEELCVIATFGYRAKEQTQKNNIDIKEMVKFI
jgi:nitroreductase